MPYTTNPHINSTGRSLLTTDGRPARENDETPHRPHRPHRQRNWCNKSTNYRNPIINLYTFGRTPQDDSTQKFNRETFLTTDGRRTVRNNDEIPHRPTNSMETARRYCTDVQINLYSAFLAPHDDLTRKFNRKTFSDGGLLQDKPILITATL